LTVTVTTSTNNPPGTPSSPSGPTSLVAGQSAPYLTDATDPDGDQVQYMFDWDANGAHSYSGWTSLVPSGTSGSISHSWSSTGTYVVKAKAKDEHGLESTGWSSGLTVTVTSSGKNNNPNTPLIPSGPITGRVGVSYNYSARTTDPDNDPVSYGWDWNGDNIVNDHDWTDFYPSGVTVNTSHIWDVAGTYNVKVKAKDVRGGMSAFSPNLTVQILPNNQPDKPDQPSGMGNGKINAEYTYQTKTTDADGDQVYYMWDWGDGSQSGWLGPSASGVTISTTHTWTVKGSYSIKVKAKDTFGAESSWSDPLPITMPTSKNLVVNNLVKFNLFILGSKWIPRMGSPTHSSSFGHSSGSIMREVIDLLLRILRGEQRGENLHQLFRTLQGLN